MAELLPDDGIRQGSATEHLAAIGSHVRFLLAALCRGGDSTFSTIAPVGAAAPRRPPGILTPSGPRKRQWDLFVMVLVLYSAVALPLRMCFDARAEGVLWSLEASISVVFLADVFVAFNTAIEIDGAWVYDRTSIAKSYFAGWFWIDAPSSVPVELIELLITTQDINNLSVLRFLRMFRLVRLLRLLKVKEYVVRLEEHFNINLKALKLVEIFLKLGFIAHFLACGWFYVHVLAIEAGEEATWISSYDDGSALEGTLGRQYLFSLYWALTTMSTVGYGDITPANDHERVFATFSLVVGALSFAFINGNVVSVLASLDNHAALVEGKMESVKEYVLWRSLPKDIVTRVRRYYEHYYEHTAVFDETDILKGLNPSLRVEVVDHILAESLGRLPIFGLLNADFKMDIFPKLKPISFAPGEIVYTKGAQSRTLFFLLAGEIDVYRGASLPSAEGSFNDAPTSRLLPPSAKPTQEPAMTDWTGELGPTARISREGEVLLAANSDRSAMTPMQAHEGIFGQATLIGRRREATLVAHTACEALLIAKEDILRLFDCDAYTARRICILVLDDFMRMDRLSMLSLRLRILAQAKQAKDELWCALTIQFAWRRYRDLLSRANDPIYEYILKEGEPHTPVTSPSVSVTAQSIATLSRAPSGSSGDRGGTVSEVTLDLRRAQTTSFRGRASGPVSYRGGGRRGGADGEMLAKMGDIYSLLLDLKGRVERLEPNTPSSSTRGNRSASDRAIKIRAPGPVAQRQDGTSPEGVRV